MPFGDGDRHSRRIEDADRSAAFVVVVGRHLDRRGVPSRVEDREVGGLGVEEGEAITHKLLNSAIATAQTVTDADRQAFCPMLAILQSQHETQYSRLFRS